MFFRIWLAKRHHYHHSPRTVGYNRQTHPIPEAEYSTSSLHPVETCCPQDRQAVPRHIVWKVSDGQQTLDNPGRKHQYPYSANQSREGNRMPTHYQDCYATNDEVKSGMLAEERKVSVAGNNNRFRSSHWQTSAVCFPGIRRSAQSR